jgi:hypothetical protein
MLYGLQQLSMGTVQLQQAGQERMPPMLNERLVRYAGRGFDQGHQLRH